LGEVGRVPFGEPRTAVSTDQKETMDHLIIWISNNSKCLYYHSFYLSVDTSNINQK